MGSWFRVVSTALALLAGLFSFGGGSLDDDVGAGGSGVAGGGADWNPQGAMFSFPAQAQPASAPAIPKALAVDRLHLLMTGLPAQPADIARALPAPLVEEARRLRTDPRFERKLTESYLEAMRIVSPIDLFGIQSANGRPVSSDFRPNESNRNDVLAVVYRGVNGSDGSEQCRGFRLLAAPPGVTRDCGCAAMVDVQPDWQPTVTLKACSHLLATNICGPRLGKCQYLTNEITNGEGDNAPGVDVLARLAKSFTQEPGVLAARAIIDDRPWSDVLLSTQSVANGPMLVFHAFQTKVTSQGVSGVAPTPVVASGAPSWTDLSYRWVERGPGNAGVLTSPGFLRTFNGHRARANAAMEAFLCRKFAVPEDAVPVVSEEPDLARRPYCAICHQTLEPMSAFFMRFSQSNNYIYRGTDAASGSFQGYSDVDVTGLARAFTRTPDFAECAVERAHRFLMGRGFTDTELVGVMPELVRVYSGAGGKLWPVFESIIASPAFSGARVGATAGGAQ